MESWLAGLANPPAVVTRDRSGSYAKAIFRRLTGEHGYTGSYYPVRRYIASIRR